MSTQITRLLSPGAALAIAATLALAACDRGAAPNPEPSATQPAPTAAPANTAAPATTELSWARAALERNPELEIVSTDEQSGEITVKYRGSGETESVKVSELVAVTPSQLAALQPAEEEPQEPTNPQARTNASDSGEGNPPVLGSTPSGYKIERSDGQIRVSGPGVSIVSSGPAAGGDDRTGGARHAVDPFICEGPRTLQLDDRDIYVEGDAITVRNGCELFLTNSRVVASGTGIVVQNATVHISNSHVEGGSASFQADDRARVYVRGSTFLGVPRRDELAMVQDQGGNKWR